MSYIFDSQVNGIPCQINVTHFRREIPAQLWGPPEECSPSEPEEFEFEVLDRRGRSALWLQRYVTLAMEERILEEFYYHQLAEVAGPPDEDCLIY